MSEFWITFGFVLLLVINDMVTLHRTNKLESRIAELERLHELDSLKGFDDE